MMYIGFGCGLGISLSTEDMFEEHPDCECYAAKISSFISAPLELKEKFNEAPEMIYGKTEGELIAKILDNGGRTKGYGIMGNPTLTFKKTVNEGDSKLIEAAEKIIRGR